MNYLDFSTEDFMADESFQNWAHQKDEESMRFWHSWLEAHPEKRPEITEAYQLLSDINLQEQPVTEHTIRQQWEKLSRQLFVPGLRKVGPGRSGSRASLILLAIPAAAAILAIVWLLNPNLFSGQLSYSTGYGETAQLLLPDGSEVSLNGHSSLHYPASWRNTADREVWLEGEGFFKITKKENHQKFRVHLPDGSSIEVLGTEFDVSCRNKKINVVLKSGKIRLHTSSDDPSGIITMQPNERVAYEAGDTYIQTAPVDPAPVTAWKENHWILKETSLPEIARMLEENYGLRVKINVSEPYDLKVSGTLPTHNLNELLMALATTLNLQITYTSDEIIISP